MTCHRAAILSLIACVAPIAAACSTAAPPAAAPAAPAATPTFESMVTTPVQAQRQAQHAWCAYLDALYHRATQDGSAWAQLARCNDETSTASPEMVERTVACSQAALEGFTGDPFTGAYAGEVKRCGASVVDALALPPGDVDPYVAALCDRAASCGATDVAGCRAEIGRRLGKRLGRSLGAPEPRQPPRVPALPPRGELPGRERPGVDLPRADPRPPALDAELNATRGTTTRGTVLPSRRDREGRPRRKSRCGVRPYPLPIHPCFALPRSPRPSLS